MEPVSKVLLAHVNQVDCPLNVVTCCVDVIALVLWANLSSYYVYQGTLCHTITERGNEW